VKYAYIPIVALLLLSGYSGAQTDNRPAAPPASQTAPIAALTPDQIIQKFAEKETKFYEAWMQYTYRQTASIRVISVNGVPQKESMTIISQVVFNDDGTREVNLTSRSGRLRSVTYTEEDQYIIENLNPFALTAKDIPLYNLVFQGKEKADELNCYVFSVKPKSIQKGNFYFQGKIWVDDQDLQIVKTFGKAVPQSRENQFPEFETVRQIIDGKHWFPVWTHAESELYFNVDTIKLEETITYDNFKKFASKATIQFPDAEKK